MELKMTSQFLALVSRHMSLAVFYSSDLITVNFPSLKGWLFLEEKKCNQSWNYDTLAVAIVTAEYFQIIEISCLQSSDLKREIYHLMSDTSEIHFVSYLSICAFKRVICPGFQYKSLSHWISIFRNYWEYFLVMVIIFTVTIFHFVAWALIQTFEKKGTKSTCYADSWFYIEILLERRLNNDEFNNAENAIITEEDFYYTLVQL